MSGFDVRKGDSSEITTIRCADPDSDYYIVEVVVKGSGPTIRLKDVSSHEGLVVLNKAHALGVIKGIQKAIELGWAE